MPRVDFYVLPDNKDNGRALLACRLADKAYTLGHEVYILVASEAQAGALDDLLWTFRQDSFIPHERYPLAGDEASPVLIGTILPTEARAYILINFTDRPRVLSATSGSRNWSIRIRRCWPNPENGSGSIASRV